MKLQIGTKLAPKFVINEDYLKYMPIDYFKV